jgi:hypothetical protein
MENLINDAPTALVQEQVMSVEAFREAVKAAAIQLQSGINAVWNLGSRAVQMAYGGSQYAHDYVEALLNNLPADAARQTHDWLKKAGIAVNRPLSGSKLYWLSFKELVDPNGIAKPVKLITVKKPGEDGFGFAKEKALLYVKTTPPMAMERKDAKPKAPTTIDKSVPAKNRAREVLVATMKRVQKKDAEAAREINELINTADNQQSCFYDGLGYRQVLDKAELKVVNRAIEAMGNGVIDAEIILKVLSGDFKVVLEEKA